ncbi:MAG: oligosaccharide flippase family protein, partial [Solirubrobacterales bacterium]
SSSSDPHAGAEGGGPDRGEVAGAAVRGSALFVTRGLVLQLVGLGATIAIARLVSPTEFGAFAIAVAAMQAGLLITSLGFPAALIRKETEPTLGEQRAIVGLTLLVGTAIAAIAAFVALVLLPLLGERSEVADLVAISTLALPLFAARLNSLVILNRKLKFERLVVIQATTQISFYLFAVTGAVVGAGAVGLSIAVPLAALVSLVVATIIQPWEWGVSLEVKAIRGLAGFGLRTGLYRLTAALYEMGTVTLFAALGGQALAGFYGLSRRLLSPVYTTMQALYMVGFPALSRAAPEERAAQTAQAVRTSLVGVGVAIAVIVGAAEPLVSALFGDRWLPAVDILTLTAAGLLLFAAVGGPLASLSLANGDARSPLLATIGQAAATFALAVALIGGGSDLTAAGVATGIGLLVFALAVYGMTAPEPVRALRGVILRTVLIAAAAAAAANLVVSGDGLLALAAAIAISAAVWTGLTALLMRSELLLLWRVSQRYLRPMLSWRPLSRAARAGES